MGAANKGIFFKVSESLSKFIRCNNKNYISNNPSPGFRYLLKHQHNEHHTNNNNKMKLLLRQSVYGKATDGSSNVHYFSMLCSDNNGRRFSLGKNYYLSPTRFCGSCNGILCLDDDHDLGKIVLWNPFTDELKSLPLSSHLSHPEADQTLFMNSRVGFDAGSQDYKVVRQVLNLFTNDDDGTWKETTIHYELFSLKSGSWRLIDNPEIDPMWESHPASSKGSCYWYCRSDGVLSFDFANEVFSRLPSPFVPNGFHYFLFDFDGSLGSIGYSIYEGRKRFDLFVWNNESWSKVDSFVLEGVVMPLGFWGRDKCFLKGENKELLLFDLNSRELKPLGIKDYRGAMSMVSFVESMVSINGHSKVGDLQTEEMKEECGSNEGSSNSDITADEIRLRSL